MKIGAPTLLLCLVSIAVAGLGLAVRLRPEVFDPAVVEDGFWILAAAYAILIVAVLKKGEDA
jgi:hypothetical protein